MKEALNAAALLAAAEKAYQQGDIRVACRIFASVARSRPATPINQQARQRLTQIADEAMQKIESVDRQLAQEAKALSPSEMLGLNGPQPTQWVQAVTTAFADYDELSERYDAVPMIRRKLRAQVAQKRRRPEYAAVLNEPEAMALCEIARQHERDQQSCCAYWVYKDAAQLAPAPAARRAVEQLASMEKDPQLMVSAEACRQLQECHALYNRAESVVKTWPSRAQELLAQIVETAPPDSEIYRAAQIRIQVIAGCMEADNAGIDN